MSSPSAAGRFFFWRASVSVTEKRVRRLDGKHGSPQRKVYRGAAVRWPMGGVFEQCSTPSLARASGPGRDGGRMWVTPRCGAVAPGLLCRADGAAL
ncbi:hypothetical protein SKAU_G00111620 [Synaphobranchus kaupii]|uniref:Uncharacterized protein n=1 Tax=Synaphobranchus kaupii TaxID=118154 RepID=A0A9Q1J852_SYNKA|nr:hypothetical protein SKAU_G00111620 [Synaphobranchus kaupii]